MVVTRGRKSVPRGVRGESGNLGSASGSGAAPDTHLIVSWRVPSCCLHNQGIFIVLVKQAKCKRVTKAQKLNMTSTS